MTRAPSSTIAFDEASWVDSVSYTAGDSSVGTTANAAALTAGDLTLRYAVLEGKAQAQTTIIQDMLVRLEAENKKLSDDKTKLILDHASQAEEIKKLKEKVDTLVKEKELLSTQKEESSNKLSVEKDELVTKTASLAASQEESKKLKEKLATLVKEKQLLSIQVEELQNTKDLEMLSATPGVLEKKAVWKSSLTECATKTGYIDVLNGPVLVSGKTKWKIAVRVSAGLRLGVVSAHETNFNTSNLGDIGGTWGYGGWGDAWFHGRRIGGQNLPYDSTGSVITFILDLTGKGTLSAAVDEKPFIKLFTNMKSVTTEFVPAIYLFNKARVEFLGFE